MKYILSQEELDELQKKQEYEIKLSKKKLQALCTNICDVMPVQWGWGSTKDDPQYFKPWGCILTAEANAEKEGNRYYHDDWYCDKCPVEDICPHPDKSWSK